MLIVDRDGSMSYQTQRVGRAWPLIHMRAVPRKTLLWILARIDLLLTMVNARRHIQSRMEVVVAYHQPACGC
jgi:hypothetical protein